jgi:excisionase family DNA binding protein
MNKEQAAEYLGITVRTLQRHMAANRISFRGGRDTGKEATFTVADLDRFKADQGALTATVSPVVSPLSESVSPAPQQALQAFLQPQDTALGERLVRVLEGLQSHQSANHTAPSISDIAQKIMLTLPEAALLTSLSRNHLRQAIEEKKLRARIIGRGWRVKREDLEVYVKKL